jgi:hypothetical protein
MRWLFERKANLSAIVVRALAGNGDGVPAGALSDLTERAGRPFASQPIYQMNCDGVFGGKKQPRQSHRGLVIMMFTHGLMSDAWVLKSGSGLQRKPNTECLLPSRPLGPLQCFGNLSRR